VRQGEAITVAGIPIPVALYNRSPEELREVVDKLRNGHTVERLSGVELTMWNEWVRAAEDFWNAESRQTNRMPAGVEAATSQAEEDPNATLDIPGAVHRSAWEKQPDRERSTTPQGDPNLARLWEADEQLEALEDDRLASKSLPDPAFVYTKTEVERMMAKVREEAIAAATADVMKRLRLNDARSQYDQSERQGYSLQRA